MGGNVVPSALDCIHVYGNVPFSFQHSVLSCSRATLQATSGKTGTAAAARHKKKGGSSEQAFVGDILLRFQHRPSGGKEKAEAGAEAEAEAGKGNQLANCHVSSMYSSPSTVSYLVCHSLVPSPSQSHTQSFMASCPVTLFQGFLQVTGGLGLGMRLSSSTLSFSPAPAASRETSKGDKEEDGFVLVGCQPETSQR